jgi:7-carboxy-7-deazaguanine synthase
MMRIRISEIFGPTVQGEGLLIGKPTVFVRTGGCDFRCSWCDTLYAVLPEYRRDWVPMTPDDILAEVARLSGGTPLLVTLSGGNPAIQPLGDLIATGREQGYSFAMETQGSVFAPWLAALDWLVLSPKPPSSGMATDWANLDQCVATDGPQAVLKIVVFDEADYAYAREVASRYPSTPLVLQTGNHTPPDADGDGDIDQAGLLSRFRWLVDRVVQDRWFEAIVLPQLHVLVWGNERGV